ncbi:hypothetical protein L596_013874 [Steinernema carpocapsae]|uniref:TIL domain-containing protein n=1 Tax=Steinernema carpocapsae TaxID=34508 RepID=A0A4U5P2I0_STECR|nr:hypothetical protein L596_013874 [Steinernema carpocapsae]
MIPRLVIVAIFLVLAEGALALQQKCRENEEWIDCGMCEGSCDQPRPVCTRECKKPGCYCPVSKGFVRFGYTQKCVSASKCPVYATSSKTKREANQKCGKNEEWYACKENEKWNDVTCEERCDSNHRYCPYRCNQNCQCKAGFARSWDEKCIPKNQCTPHPLCAKTNCGPGSVCVLTGIQCYVSPCPQQTACAPLLNF